MKPDTLGRLKQALVELDVAKSDELLNEALSFRLESMKILDALRAGMEEVGQMFEKGEYFVSNLVMEESS